MSEKLNNAIPVFAGVIVVLAFFLLMIVFRSILVPLKSSTRLYPFINGYTRFHNIESFNMALWVAYLVLKTQDHYLHSFRVTIDCYSDLPSTTSSS